MEWVYVADYYGYCRLSRLRTMVSSGAPDSQAGSGYRGVMCQMKGCRRVLKSVLSVDYVGIWILMESFGPIRGGHKYRNLGLICLNEKLIIILSLLQLFVVAISKCDDIGIN
jgi:hypothetical protein